MDQELAPPLVAGRRRFEALEPRHLLSGDIALTGFSALGNDLLIEYEVVGRAAEEFDLGVWRSIDETPLMTHRVTGAPDLQPGGHAVTIRADFADVAEDYVLVARLDAGGEVAETDETNNQRQFAGGVFTAADGVVHVHGGSGADTIGLMDLGDRLEIWSGPGPQQLAVVGPHTAVHVRSHAGHDEVSVYSTSSARAPVWAFGGAGDDTLEGGRGDDILWGGPGVDLVDGELDVWQFLNNGRPGYSERGDGWQTSTDGRPDEGDQRVHGPGNGAAVWTFSGLQPGMSYDVITIFVPDGGRTTTAAYTVRDGLQVEAAVVVNQQEPAELVTEGKACAELGRFPVHSGTLSVELAAAADGTVSADCVAIVEALELAEPASSDSGDQPEAPLPAASLPAGGGGGGEMLLGGEGAVTVVGRHVFYNNSFFDGNDPAANAQDDGAIPPPSPFIVPPPGGCGWDVGKTALLPGQTAAFKNYTSYSRGINGIMVDIAGLADPSALGQSDFQFKVGNDDTPSDWTPAPAPSIIVVREYDGVDDSHRATIIWADNAIDKEWLQVTVLATANTGLALPDVFYFGNAIGECGNSTTDAKVTEIDMLAARNNPHDFLDPAPLWDFVDFNRDERVNATDMLIARDNQTHFLSALKLITVPQVVADRFYLDPVNNLFRVEYRVVGEDASQLDVHVFRSYDGVHPWGEPILTAQNPPPPMTAGSHDVAIAPNFADVEEDYFLIAVVTSNMGTSNSAVFEGGIFTSDYGQEQIVHVHGSDLEDAGNAKTDTVFIEGAGGSYHVLFNEGRPDQQEVTALAPEVFDAFHVRTHDGDDSVETPNPLIGIPGFPDAETWNLSTVDKPMWVFGGDGHDGLMGGDMADKIYGGSGDDDLGGRPGNDVMYGQDGDDQLEGHNGDDTLYGDDGNDKLSGWGNADLIFGGRGDDNISEALAPGDLQYDEPDEGDAIYGGDGNDQIDGFLGTDMLYGDGQNALGVPATEPGDDEIYGWLGADYIVGGGGRDNLFGDDGNDQILGGDGDDWIDGGAGDDNVNPGTGVGRSTVGILDGTNTYYHVNAYNEHFERLETDEGLSYEWVFTGLEIGRPYTVFGTWVPEADHGNSIGWASNAPYDIYDGTTLLTPGGFTEDHRALPGFDWEGHNWEQLGEQFGGGYFTITTGTLKVKLYSVSLHSVCVDAVMVLTPAPRLDLLTDCTGWHEENGFWGYPPPQDWDGWDDREETGFHGGRIVFPAEGRVRVDLARYDDGFDLRGKTLRLDWSTAPGLISVWDSPTGGAEIQDPSDDEYMTWTIDTHTIPSVVWVQREGVGQTDLTLSIDEAEANDELPVPDFIRFTLSPS